MFPLRTASAHSFDFFNFGKTATVRGNGSSTYFFVFSTLIPASSIIRQITAPFFAGGMAKGFFFLFAAVSFTALFAFDFTSGFGFSAVFTSAFFAVVTSGFFAILEDEDFFS